VLELVTARATRWGLLAVAIGAIGIAARSGCTDIRQRWIPFAIHGTSMQPALETGQFVLVDTARGPRAGDIVVARRPDRPELEVVKRVSTIGADSTLYLLGDNAAQSTDSRQFGAVSAEDIVGVVRWRYWPPWQAKRIG